MQTAGVAGPNATYAPGHNRKKTRNRNHPGPFGLLFAVRFGLCLTKHRLFGIRVLLWPALFMKSLLKSRRRFSKILGR